MAGVNIGGVDPVLGERSTHVLLHGTFKWFLCKDFHQTCFGDSKKMGQKYHYIIFWAEKESTELMKIPELTIQGRIDM